MIQTRKRHDERDREKNVAAPTMQSSVLLTKLRMALKRNQGRLDGSRKDMGGLD
jgi:hypothetical protein